MTRRNKGLTSLYTALFALILIFNGCENPGSVGDDFTNSPVVTFDTLEVKNTSVLNFEDGYSGNFPFMAMGKYNDQIFGDIDATTFVRPIRNPNIPDSLEIEGNNFSMKLEVGLDSAQTYGDTLGTASFSVYEITSLWRGTSHRVNDELDYNEANLIGQFQVGSEKNILIDLADSWKDKYASYLNNEEDNADSLYQYEFHGLAIVPTGSSGKIDFPNASETRFLILNEDQTDTASVPLNNWAYSINRSNVPQTEGAFPLHTTMESAMRIVFPTEELKQKHSSSNIIKSELIFYSAEENLQNSLPVNHYRPNINLLGLNQRTVDDDVFEYQLTDPDFIAPIIEDSAYFKAPVNTFVNNALYGEEEQNEMIVGIGSSSGILRSTLIFNSEAPSHKKPKLIITYIVNEEN
ncbi:hypothetical protein [Gracilimonas sp.]|uniref:hypothetical protein n=1 Tax=Gracilimonas sp. TaxID=1974203 RepID=UPI002870B81E|nr:hypothetical protein [Gracilimonas sp.]